MEDDHNNMSNTENEMARAETPLRHLKPSRELKRKMERARQSRRRGPK